MTDIEAILRASVEGRLSPAALDQFSCVHIAYDPRLDRLRQRYNDILDDPASWLAGADASNATPLSERGRARVRALIDEVGVLRA